MTPLQQGVVVVGLFSFFVAVIATISWISTTNRAVQLLRDDSRYLSKRVLELQLQLNKLTNRRDRDAKIVAAHLTKLLGTKTIPAEDVKFLIGGALQELRKDH